MEKKRAMVIFTIQNVPIKLCPVSTVIEVTLRFTIQNVPIKFSIIFNTF